MRPFLACLTAISLTAFAVPAVAGAASADIAHARWSPTTP